MNYVKNNAIKLFIPLTKIHSHQHPLWFTSDIRHQLKCLRTLRRKFKHHPTNNMAVKINSLESHLQENITVAKNNFESSIINSFVDTSNKKIYNYIKSLNKSKNLPATVFFDSQVASTDMDKANLFNCYFHSVFSSSSSLSSTDDLPESSRYLNIIEFTETEVFQVLTTLDPNKALGNDNISPRILRACPLALYKPLHHLFTLSIRNGVIPAQWKIHKITPIFKSGDPSLVNNY